jgi:hypothetical protein
MDEERTFDMGGADANIMRFALWNSNEILHYVVEKKKRINSFSSHFVKTTMD